MKKNLLCRILALGIVFLFVGVSYASAVSGEIKSTKAKNVEHCDCKAVSETDLIFLTKQLNKVEVYGKLLNVLSITNSESREIIKGLVDEIKSLIVQFEELTNEPFPIICDILLKISIHLATLESYFFDLFESSEENSLEWVIAVLIYEIVFQPIFGPMILFVIYGWDVFQCEGNIS